MSLRRLAAAAAALTLALTFAVGAAGAASASNYKKVDGSRYSAAQSRY